MQRIETRTIHTICIDVQDDVLSAIDPADEVEVILQGRSGQTARKRLTYRDLEALLGDAVPLGMTTKRRVNRS